MTLTWPWALVGLVVVPLFVVGYRRALARQERGRQAMAAQGLVVVPAPRRDRWRHVGAGLLLAALAVLVVSLTRPVATVGELHREGTVVLAFDVSNSMAATDVKPSRLDAAKAAANAFVEKQPPSVRIAVVAFGGTGLVTQRPTTDRQDVLAAVARLRPSGETSLAGGILGGLSAIVGKPVKAPGDAEIEADQTLVGYHPGTAIVLLTDGEDTTDTDPRGAAELASAAGVHIEPIGVGAPTGAIIRVDGYSIATALDEKPLQAIAQLTGGTYRRASDAAALASVYDSIELQWTTRTVPHEVTSWVAAFGALLLLGGATVSVLRQGEVV